MFYVMFIQNSPICCNKLFVSQYVNTKCHLERVKSQQEINSMFAISCHPYSTLFFQIFNSVRKSFLSGFLSIFIASCMIFTHCGHANEKNSTYENVIQNGTIDYANYKDVPQYSPDQMIQIISFFKKNIILCALSILVGGIVASVYSAIAKKKAKKEIASITNSPNSKSDEATK